MRYGLPIVLLGLLAVCAAAAVDVVTATTDLASITRAVGGTRVTVASLALPDQDLHRVDPRPSFVAKLARAKMVVRVGMDLDAWMDSLIQASRNAKIRKGAAGYDITFIHPKGNEQFPLGGEGVLIELVQAPAEVIAALG